MLGEAAGNGVLVRAVEAVRRAELSLSDDFIFNGGPCIKIDDIMYVYMYIIGDRLWIPFLLNTPLE